MIKRNFSKREKIQLKSALEDQGFVVTSRHLDAEKVIDDLSSNIIADLQSKIQAGTIKNKNDIKNQLRTDLLLEDSEILNNAIGGLPETISPYSGIHDKTSVQRQHNLTKIYGYKPDVRRPVDHQPDNFNKEKKKLGISISTGLGGYLPGTVASPSSGGGAASSFFDGVKSFFKSKPKPPKPDSLFSISFKTILHAIKAIAPLVFFYIVLTVLWRVLRWMTSLFTER